MRNKLLFILFLTYSVFSQAENIEKSCQKNIKSIEVANKNLEETLNKTKNYIKSSTWIINTKQLEINGHWKEVDTSIEESNISIEKLKIVNDKDICEKVGKKTVEQLNYINESNLIIMKEIDYIVKIAPKIVTETLCNSQNQCNGYFFYYFQKNLNSVAFNRYSEYVELSNQLKEEINLIPPVNLRKKELILY